MPLLTAMADLKPGHVVFVASQDDALTSKKTGTWRTVDGPGLHFKSDFKLASPDLPNLVTLANLAPGSYETLQVPADNLDEIVEIVHAHMSARQASDVVADYTGGTKSMTAGLALCAARLGARLSVVVGPRLDTIKVQSDEQRENAGLNLNEQLLLDQAAHAWSRFDYESAVGLLARARTDTGRRIRGLSRGYALWDGCRFAEARELLRGTWTAFVAGPHLAFLGQLTADNVQTRRAALVVDMELRSDRHHEAGRYDTAVLTRYRAVEAIAQWALLSHEVDAADVDAAKHPAVAELANPAHDGKLKLANDKAWQALQVLKHPLGAVYEPEALRGFAALRNESVLAHGERALSGDDASRFRDWYDRAIRPAFAKAAFRNAAPPPQLPKEFPA
jgi:CRISPR-associated protein (TIGR02710 family)